MTQEIGDVRLADIARDLGWPLEKLLVEYRADKTRGSKEALITSILSNTQAAPAHRVYEFVQLMSHYVKHPEAG